MLRDFEALLLEVVDDFVPLLGETKERGTRDVLLLVRETRTQPFLEFHFSIRNGNALPFVAHGGVCLWSQLGPDLLSR
jgi:hypothetical protein